jgi:cytochrome c oxidase accessory protein FixG
VPNQPENKEIQYFAARKQIYPRAVSGFYRALKWIILTVCLGVYYLAPFLRYDRGPNAPDQAILIDLNHGRAYWFMVEIWPQEVYYLTGILILAAIVLFAATAILGRVWCGYFCFQTVWTDLFMLVERWIQGDRNARIKLDASPWTISKFLKKLATHISWLFIGLITGGAFILYFNDAPELMWKILNGDIPKTPALFALGLMVSTYIMAGIAREQVCTFMCPYARFQSAMLDRDSLIVTYDPLRGEPRAAHKKGDPWGDRSHCIDCGMCVQVCPTGIDIRNGLQMQCIACALCIDACDNVMDKIGLPRGLIRYDTENDMESKASGGNAAFRLIRPRTIYYMALISIIGLTMLAALIARPNAELHVLQDRNPLFVTLSDGSIRNGYVIKILNRTYEDQAFRLDAIIDGQKPLDLSGLQDQKAGWLKVEPDSVGEFKFFVTLKPDSAPDHIDFSITNLSDKKVYHRSATFSSHQVD